MLSSGGASCIYVALFTAFIFALFYFFIMNNSVQNKMCLLLSLTLPVNQQLSFPILLVVLFLMIIDISNLVLQYFFVALLLMIIDFIFSIKNTNVRFFPQIGVMVATLPNFLLVLFQGLLLKKM